MRGKLIREAASTKRGWQARLAAVKAEEAVLQPQLEALAGDNDLGPEALTQFQ